MEFAKGKVDPYLAVEFRQWALGLADRANQKTSVISQVSLDQKLSQVVFLQVPSAGAVVEAAKAGSARSETVGRHEMLLFDNRPSKPDWLGVVAVDAGTVAAGDAVAVRQVLAIASGQAKPLYDARPDLHPLLEAFSSSQVTVFRFQPLDVATGAGCLGGALGNGNPLFSLVGVRGHAFGSRKTDRQCTVSVAFQYANRVPSSVVSTVFGMMSALNTIPVGIPPELGSPQSMDAEQERGMAMLTAEFDVARCDEVDKKNRESEQKKATEPDHRQLKKKRRTSRRSASNLPP